MPGILAPVYRKVLEGNIPMASGSRQLTLNFEPGLCERHPSLKAHIRHRVYSSLKPLKAIAGDMDLSETELTRKLGDNPNDPRNFTVDDLERYIASQNDVMPIYYLIEKFAVSEEAKHAYAAAEFARMLPEILALAKQMKVKG